MISPILLELLSVTALLFSILLIYLEFAPLALMSQIFAWVVMAGLFYFYGCKWAKIFRLSALLMFAPLLFYYENSVALAFLSIVAVSLTLYLERFFHRGSHDDYVDNFKRMAAIYPFAFFVRWALSGMSEAVNRAAPFIFVYFLSSILLIRLTRHVEAGMDIRRLQGTNVGYLIFIAVFFLLTSVEKVRHFIGFMTRQLIALLLLPLRLLLWALGWVLASFSGWLMKRPIDWLNPFEMPDFGSSDEFTLPPPGEQPAIVALILGILKVALLCLIVGGVIFFLYKLLARLGQSSYRGLDYVEEREYLGIGGLRRKRGFRLRDRFPKHTSEQVRYYYRRFLEKLIAQEVPLTKADTSLAIQEKAETVYSHGPKQIRDIYIASRYGEKEVDSNAVRKIEQLYREL